MIDEIESVQDEDHDTYSLVISGTASDLDSGLPLEEVKITLLSKETLPKGKILYTEKSAYTDNNGMFKLQADNFHFTISVTVTAEDPNGNYMNATHEVQQISWDSSYNMHGGTFYINDCNFHLKKSE